MAEKMKKGENTEETTEVLETTEQDTEKKSAEKWIITLTKNKNFCGIGAGSVHFAHGRAETSSKVLADWFKEHDGYEVKKC
jgi:argonaute-like protein implicated in RNA metabolism and viral defense